MKVLVTGTAGFIGFHVANRLLERGDEVVGLDNINDYYSTRLKFDRLKNAGIQEEDIKWNSYAQSKKFPNYHFIRLDLKDQQNVAAVFNLHQFDAVIHLAAQAGVRHSLNNPEVYVQSNISGFLNILEGCRHHAIKHLVYASSSSVYGLNENMPFSTSDNVDHPVSLYGATKKSNELMAHSYSHLFGLPTTGLRLFTVYGPWGRPDMAYFLFTKAMLEDRVIEVFNHGNMKRDFTYVNDVVEGIVRVADNPPAGNKNWSGKTPDPAYSKAPYRIFNLGNNHPVRLMDFINAIENQLEIKAQLKFLPLQAGDVLATYADVQDLMEELDYKPETPVTTGINHFLQWYLEYYKIEAMQPA